MKSLVALVSLFLILSLPSHGFAEHDFNEELLSIAQAMSTLTTFSVSMDIDFKGEGVERRPNFPRTATLFIATNGLSDNNRFREAELTAETPLGGFSISLVLQGQMIYLHLAGPEGKNLSYYVDSGDKKAARSQQMVAAMVNTTDMRLQAMKGKGLDVLRNITSKANLTFPSPGEITVRSKRGREDIDFYYDLETHLPQKLVVYNRKTETEATFYIREWVKKGVEPSLPLPKETYVPFTMKSIGEITTLLPKSSQLMAETKPEIEMPEPTDEKSQDYFNDEVRKEMRAAIVELRNVMEVLQDKAFQRSLKRATESLNKLEKHLNRLDELKK